MIQIVLDDDYEVLLGKLQEHDKEKTAVGMVRNLIRDGLRERGLWPVPAGQSEREETDRVAV